ncbi:MAG: YbaK/EbsC family protein [Thermomicrobia bacterium]|nr:YbaK/EbsC family protein [Thermomicrobia bacterium]
MNPTAQRIADALAALDVETTVIEFAESTRTAEEAAAAIGTQVGQIVKSLVFMAGNGPVLALISGTNRLDPARLTAWTGDPPRRATADEVRTATGFAIGGVPPIGHSQSLRTFIDRDLTQYETVFAAAGTPHAVFAIAPAALARITGGQVIDLAARSTP